MEGPPPALCPTGLWLQKAGNEPEENEDAFRVRVSGEPGDRGRGSARIAVCDGASESAFAREWADTLAEAFVSRPPAPEGTPADCLVEWLRPAQESWHAAVPWDLLPWHGEAKTRAGAFSTLLGLTIAARPDHPGQLSWQALAVGDSCLFLVRDDRLLLSFPLDEAAQFDNHPDLICSNPENAGELREWVNSCAGECAAGDLFVLASDALACWFLECVEGGEKPWVSLAELDQAGWSAWVEEQRRGGLMRNDDTTLVLAQVA